MNIFNFIGFLSVLFVFVRFIKKLGNELPIPELMLLIAGLQWIVGPLIEYNSPNLHFKYFMYVAEDTYMSFVVPAYIVFVIGVLLLSNRSEKYFIPQIDFSGQSSFAIKLLLVGVVADYVRPSFPGGLQFFLYLFGNFKFAGAIILYFSNNGKYRNLFYLVIIYLFYRSLQQAMFHDFVLWSAFFFMFWALKFKPSVKTILATFLVAFIFLSSLQTVKSAYRSEVWGGYQGNKVGLFFTLFTDALLNEGLFAEVKEEELDNNVRLNQGWIISAIMDHVPNNEAFFEGETIRTAFETAALPGFMRKNKTVAGGRENFMRFTGLEIGEGTSMGISIVGEAYGNYGVNGGILFMALWGLFLGRIWLFLMKYSQNNLLFLAFLPLIFLQVVKAETELVVVLNHLIKAMVVVFMFFMLIRRRKNTYSYG